MGDIVFFLPRQISHPIEHIFHKDAVSDGRVIDENVGDSSDQLAVLQNGRARQVCGQ